MRGVRTKVGIILISSKLLAYTAFINPSIENKKLINRVRNKASATLCMGMVVKLNDTIYTTNPTTNAIDTPPRTYPIKIT